MRCNETCLCDCSSTASAIPMRKMTALARFVKTFPRATNANAPSTMSTLVGGQVPECSSIWHDSVGYCMCICLRVYVCRCVCVCVCVCVCWAGGRVYVCVCLDRAGLAGLTRILQYVRVAKVTGPLIPIKFVFFIPFIDEWHPE